MDILNEEYKFGRFGYDDGHTAARSFLLFTMYTDFTHTVVAGTQQPLRKEETNEDRFERRPREDNDFQGTETLQRLSTSIPWAPKPAETEWLGPYAESTPLFLEDDIQAVLQQCARKGSGLVDPWKQRVEKLLNEMFLSYLERYLVPIGESFHRVLAAAEALTPQRHEERSLDSRLFQFLIQPHADPFTEWEIRVWDIDGVAERVRNFLRAHSGEEGGLFKNDYFIIGLCRYLGFLLGQILEMARRGVMGSHRSKIMPTDIRINVVLQSEYILIFKFSRVFWDGSE
ncbi:MAG: hypothetical protein L6R41_008410 [Letrouitia leprolyta]|nr:MAG: hypothetical protein L6R41_008410 [Letrouitia leprolyta]